MFVCLFLDRNSDLAGKTQSNHLRTTFNEFYGQKYGVSDVPTYRAENTPQAIKCMSIYSVQGVVTW